MNGIETMASSSVVSANPRPHRRACLVGVAADMASRRGRSRISRLIFVISLVGNSDPGQSLDEIESRAGHIQCREHDGAATSRRPAKGSSHLGEEAFVIDQLQISARTKVRRSDETAASHFEIRLLGAAC